MTERLPMISAQCLNEECGQPWVATVEAMAKWPSCPFCGSTAVRRVALPTEEDATGWINGEGA